MRKYRRILFVLLTLFIVPAGNALDMSCFPGKYHYYVNVGWRCEFSPEPVDCIVCYAVVTVPG